MKKILSILAFTAVAAIIMVSCKNSTSASQQISPYDTIGLSAFQSWKLQQYQEAMNMNTVPVATVVTTPAKKVSYAKSNTGSSSGSMNTTSTHAAKAPVKKGMSKAAKGAIIGGAGGAVLGAVINKRNRVAGGVIGAVLGAGGGYVLGRSKDKKDGRY
jgi:hypothetical protein